MLTVSCVNGYTTVTDAAVGKRSQLSEILTANSHQSEICNLLSACVNTPDSVVTVPLWIGNASQVVIEERGCISYWMHRPAGKGVIFGRSTAMCTSTFL